MFRHVVLASVAIALAAGITACGSAGPAGPLGSDSVATIISDATANTLASQSYTISGGTSATSAIDLTIVRDVGCAGTVSQSGGESQLKVIGKTAYAHSPTMPANEWMKGSTTDAGIQALVNLCTPSNYLTPLLTATSVSSATRSASVYNGHQALTLTIPGTTQDNDQPWVIIVTDTSGPLLLKVSQPGAGTFTFTGYGAANTIAPPTDA